MSYCPTCGHWEPDPIPFDFGKRLGPCPLCIRDNNGAGDVELTGSNLGYSIECHRCGLTLGYSNDRDDLVRQWNKMTEEQEAKP